MRTKETTRYLSLPYLAGVDLMRATFFTHSFSRHFHEDYALGCIEHGAMRFRYRGSGLVAPAGHVNLVVPGEAHDGHAADATGWTYSMFYLQPETVLAAAQSLDPKAKLPHFRQGVINDPDLAARVKAAHSLLMDRDAPRLAKETRLLSLLRFWIRRYAEDPGPAPKPPAQEPDMVAKAKEYLAAHMQDDISLDDLASVSATSPFHLARAFTAQTGIPPHAFLVQLRLGRAKDLLGTPMRLADIAAETGFSDQSHLTRRFKRQFGVTPGVMRKNIQNFSM
mgnify:FL=1